MQLHYIKIFFLISISYFFRASTITLQAILIPFYIIVNSQEDDNSIAFSMISWREKISGMVVNSALGH